MTPNTDERLASIVRALTEVVLPHLPPEASLAQEQVHLAIGHLQILRAQLDNIPAFEREELDDTKALAAALAGVTGGVATSAANAALKVSAEANGDDVRAATRAINLAIAGLVQAVSLDGAVSARKSLAQTILKFEHARAQKDRDWFRPFGFDAM